LMTPSGMEVMIINGKQAQNDTNHPSSVINMLETNPARHETITICL